MAGQRPINRAEYAALTDFMNERKRLSKKLTKMMSVSDGTQKKTIRAKRKYQQLMSSVHVLEQATTQKYKVYQVERIRKKIKEIELFLDSVSICCQSYIYSFYFHIYIFVLFIYIFVLFSK